jgi:hypothetical protein
MLLSGVRTTQVVSRPRNPASRPPRETKLYCVCVCVRERETSLDWSFNPLRAHWNRPPADVVPKGSMAGQTSRPRHGSLLSRCGAEAPRAVCIVHNIVRRCK